MEEGVSKETAEKLLSMQKRCIVCGSTNRCQLHHRIFRSEGEKGLEDFLKQMAYIYEADYKKSFKPWKLNDIQNLCVLCQECHEGSNGVHGRGYGLRMKLKNSFSEPTTGFNINFQKNNLLF